MIRDTLHSRLLTMMRRDLELGRYKRQLLGCCKTYSDKTLRKRISGFLIRCPQFEDILRPFIIEKVE